MVKEKNALVKENWSSSFNLIGIPKINDFTYKIDAKSEKSDWIYNSLNLGIDCGEQHGIIYCELMGGYGAERQNVIYAHGKNDDGTDDFSQRMEIEWEDRNESDVLENVGDLCFITVGLEKTEKNKTFYKKFLSAYDAIAYVHAHLTEDMVVNVKGNLHYSTYNDHTQIRKIINSIVLSSIDDVSKYKATFTQTMLLDSESASLNNIDVNKGIMYVNSRVLDYVKEYNGVEVKGNFPYSVQFEFGMDFSNKEQCQKIADKLFKVKNGTVTQITFDGEFVESGATVTATWDDVPDDIKDLVNMGIYSEEEALAKCSSNGSKERRMVLKKPTIKMVGDDTKVPVLQKFDEKFEENDLLLDCMIKKDDNDVPFNEDEESDDDGLDWLNNL